MEKTADMRGWKDLVFVIISKVAWLGISMAMVVVIYKLMLGMFFNELGLTSPFWVVLTGVVSFGLGTVLYRLYDTAFD